MKYLLEKEETERIHFRRIDDKDFSLWLEFFMDPTSFAHWICSLQDPEVECEKWYEKQFERYQTDQGGMNALWDKGTGKLMGHCGLLVQQVDNVTELEIAYSLLPDFRNKGYATEAARKCKEFAFQHSFSDSLISIISLTNIASANVAFKNGMKIEKQTVYHQNPVNIFRVNNT
jgi:[ribosomal protein S5]-alanine N-acetyltransferase